MVPSDKVCFWLNLDQLVDIEKEEGEYKNTQSESYIVCAVRLIVFIFGGWDDCDNYGRTHFIYPIVNKSIFYIQKVGQQMYKKSCFVIVFHKNH